MKYEFPHINNIDDVLPAIEGSPEFIVAEKDDYIVVNYVVAMTDTFPEVNTAGGSAKMREEATRHKAIRRECRGIIFNKDGTILSRRLHKFFNVNERDETLSHKIDFSQPHVILEKLDGSMITPIKIGDHIRWGTKMGVTQVSMGAEEYVARNPQYDTFARWCIDEVGVTPIFEWCSRKQRIVVDYPTDRLVLVAARDIRKGTYVNYDWLQAYGKEYSIEVVKAYDGTTQSMEHLIAETRGQEGIEGWIIRFDDGHMVKVKGDWYVRIHKTKDAISQEKNIVSSIVNETIDDSKAFMLEEDRKRVEEYEKSFINGLNTTVQLYEEMLEHYRSKYDRKNFALNSEDMHPHLRSTMFSCWDGTNNVRDTVLNIIKKSVGSQSKIDEIRHLWNGAKWNYNSFGNE